MDLDQSGQILLLGSFNVISAPYYVNYKSAKEDLAEAFNKFNMKAKTVDSIKTPLFAKILHNTDSIHTKTKENDEDT